MRVFQRGLDESLVIGENTIITVLDIQSDHIRLGIQSDEEIPGYREEVIYFEPAEEVVCHEREVSPACVSARRSWFDAALFSFIR